MNYEAILFDADGMTLVSRRFSEQIEQDYGIPWARMKPFFDGPFVQCKLGRADLKEELSKVMLDWGWKGSVEELMAYWFAIGSTPSPEIVALAKELRSGGVKCFLATNQEKYRAEYLWNVAGLKDVFDGLLASSDFGHMKDEVAYFAEALVRLETCVGAPLGASLLKERILFVDHEEKNLAAAKEFGFAAYEYHDIQSFKEFVAF